MDCDGMELRLGIRAVARQVRVPHGVCRIPSAELVTRPIYPQAIDWTNHWIGGP